MDIDLVYLWVNGNDPEWIAKKEMYQGKRPEYDAQSAIKARFVDNGELRYSLRSVERYAPWFHRIYIITGGQVPEWLDTSNPKIRIVSHSEILPADALPVFNADAIETCIPRIEGLSEHFVVGNDDLLFGATVTPSMFFGADNRAVVRFKGVKFHAEKAVKRTSYARVIYRMMQLAEQKWGVHFAYAPHHCFDAYTKTDYAACIGLFADAWRRTEYNKFRTDDDMDRAIISFYQVISHHGVAKNVGRYDRLHSVGAKLHALVTNRDFATDSRVIPLDAPDFDKIFDKYNPAMYCMNDCENATDADRRRMCEFLARRLPAKSSFEK